jgi:hypothetical protein
MSPYLLLLWKDKGKNFTLWKEMKKVAAPGLENLD